MEILLDTGPRPGRRPPEGDARRRAIGRAIVIGLCVAGGLVAAISAVSSVSVGL